MSIAHGPAEAARHPYQWWEYRWAVVAFVLVSAIPLLWPDVPPIVDLPGHMGRYQVQLELANSPELQRYYVFHWAIIGNLGVDLIVQALGPIFGIEPVVKMVAISIPMLTAAGLLWVAREVHGRVPPTALFALPFAFNYPFLFGFINFALAMALALLAFALWLRLARKGRLGLRAALFVPISVLIWIVHAFGWGTLGVLAFSAELVRQHDHGRSYHASAFRAGIHCLSLVPPVALMLAWRSDASGQTGDWFNWSRKWEWLTGALRDRWKWFDLASLALVTAIIFGAFAIRRVTYSRNMFASTLFLVAVFVLLPRIVFGSAYADMRLAPYLFAIALVAIRFKQPINRKLFNAIGVAGLAFFLVRTAGTTISTSLYDQRYDRELAALEHIPRGAKMVSFVGRPCVENWAMTRLLHLPALAITRRHAFSNDQWTMAGAQLLQVIYHEGWPFVRDASEVVVARRCRGEVWRTLDQSLATFPRHAFDYVWLIDPPQHDPALTAGLSEVWRDGSSVLYRVERPQPAETPEAQ